jgi:hypothetical protein
MADRLILLIVMRQTGQITKNTKVDYDSLFIPRRPHFYPPGGSIPNRNRQIPQNRHFWNTYGEISREKTLAAPGPCTAPPLWA